MKSHDLLLLYLCDNKFIKKHIIINTGLHSAVGKAADSHAEGFEFESR
jgi:hypothetical protein